ncbi:hypothetical protein Zm00014a_022309 [Zea mays]|uniref:Uncharacterized protein n=1 Tax=Zea mays TaxID=4577 RepID=A0A3L6E5A1_MAIZE|nr:hypothetical protein Zm00014a_022309 [Zea mays]
MPKPPLPMSPCSGPTSSPSCCYIQPMPLPPSSSLQQPYHGCAPASLVSSPQPQHRTCRRPHVQLLHPPGSLPAPTRFARSDRSARRALPMPARERPLPSLLLSIDAQADAELPAPPDGVVKHLELKSPCLSKEVIKGVRSCDARQVSEFLDSKSETDVDVDYNSLYSKLDFLQGEKTGRDENEVLKAIDYVHELSMRCPGQSECSTLPKNFRNPSYEKASYCQGCYNGLRLE